MNSRDLPSWKQQYREWRTTRDPNRAASATGQIPQSGHGLLYALESGDTGGVGRLAAVVAGQIAKELWLKRKSHDSAGELRLESLPNDSAFVDAVVVHTARLVAATAEVTPSERLWTTVGLTLSDRLAGRDEVLNRLLSQVEAALPKPGASQLVFRIFVRDFLLEITLAEAVRYELEGRSASDAAIKLFREFLYPKIAPRLRRRVAEQDREDLRAEIEEGLLGFGQATANYRNRMTIKEFDRSCSSLAHFVIETARWVDLSSASRPVLYGIREDALQGLAAAGFPPHLLPGLQNLQGRTWRTWKSCSRSLQGAAPELFSPGNEHWLRLLQEGSGVYETAMPENGSEHEPAPVRLGNVIAPRGMSADGDGDSLIEIVRSPEQFASFLQEWSELGAAERKRLQQKFMLLKILVLQKCLDEWSGASPASSGCLQLKFVVLQGISELTLGVSDGVTTHLGPDDGDDTAVRRETVAEVGFVRHQSAHARDGDRVDAWDLLRIMYTISFVSTLWRDDEATRTARGLAGQVRDEPDGGCRIPLAWLAEHALERGTERNLDRDRIQSLLGKFTAALNEFAAAGRQTTEGEDGIQGTTEADENGLRHQAEVGEDVLVVHVRRDDVVAYVRYPHLLLATYAPNAFAAMYWNIQQGSRLGIAEIRSKFRDLRVSLDSLRRFLDGTLSTE
jgi:hypothetical protein